MVLMKRKGIIAIAISALTLAGCSTSDTDTIGQDAMKQREEYAATHVSGSPMTPSKWRTLEDVAESINNVNGGCDGITYSEEGIAGCGGDNGYYLFALDTADHPSATGMHKISSLTQDRDSDEVMLWDEGWSIQCWEKAVTNCQSLNDEFPDATWVDLEAGEGMSFETVPDIPDGGFGDGTHLVGDDIQPGTYRNDGETGRCYWKRLSGFGGTLDDIIANAHPEGQSFVTIDSSDAAFESKNCGTWEPVE